MKLTSSILVIVISIILGGCVSTQERQAQVINKAKYNCSAYGHGFGSQSFANCVQREVYQIQAREEQSSRDLDNAIQDANCAFGPIGCKRASKTRCTRDAFGGLNCNSW